MKDVRYEKLADNLINYSLKLKEGEKILIEFISANPTGMLHIVSLVI